MFRRDTERQALMQLDKARTKPVAFAVKTNVAFDGTLDDDSPVHGSAVSFSMGDYLHVMERCVQKKITLNLIYGESSIINILTESSSFF